MTSAGGFSLTNWLNPLKEARTIPKNKTFSYLKWDEKDSLPLDQWFSNLSGSHHLEGLLNYRLQGSTPKLLV